MDNTHLPTEDEQFEAYKETVETMQGKTVIIRTLDIGGDKDIPYMDFEKEENPFLGFRAVRYCIANPDMYKTQLRHCKGQRLWRGQNNGTSRNNSR